MSRDALRNGKRRLGQDFALRNALRDARDALRNALRDALRNALRGKKTRHSSLARHTLRLTDRRSVVVPL